MSESVLLARLPWGSLTRLRDLLELWSSLQAIAAPWTSVGGLRDVLTAVLHWSTEQSLNGAWQSVLQRIIADDALLELLAAGLRFLLSRDRSTVASQAVHAQAWSEWLSVLLQVLALLRQFQERPAS